MEGQAKGLRGWPRGPWLARACLDSSLLRRVKWGTERAFVWGPDDLLVAPAWPLACWVTLGRPLPLLDFSSHPPQEEVGLSCCIHAHGKSFNFF